MPPAFVPDTERRGLANLLPGRARALFLLARFDRPIGAWLLYWPGAWAVALAGAAVRRWDLLLWLGLGAVAMRGAGCVFNDIADRELDARVARTRDRPLASGALPLWLAWAWLVALSLVGLVVLLQLDRPARLVALGSLFPVACYPFMKRITWWPQAWLGLVFSWGALVGWPAATGGFDPALGWLYAGAVAWVVAYDTIYALQDLEDDALAGVRSSARALGGHVRAGVAAFQLLALACWAAALWRVRPDPLAWLALAPVAAHFAWQTVGLRMAEPVDALRRFRANRFAGLLVFLACLAVGSAGG